MTLKRTRSAGCLLRAMVVALSSAAAISVLAPQADAAPPKPVPTPFPVGAIATVYQSDVHGRDILYWPVISKFVDVRQRHPEIIDENMDKAAAINQSAKDDPALQNRALDDAYAIDGATETQLYTMTDAFGVNLGRQMREALAQRRLPKVAALVDTVAARGQGPAASTAVEKLLSDNERPYEAEPDRIQIYNRPGRSKSDVLSTGSSYPSGHTTSAMVRTGLLALMVPELAPQLMARGSEAGYHRVVLGVHYPLDVIAGRMVADAVVADRWADPRFRPLIVAAGQELRAELQWRCGAALAVCISRDTPYLTTAQAVVAYDQRLGYGFSRVGRANARFVVPPTAIDLVARSHPGLTRAQRIELLQATAGPAGHPLDDQRAGGQSWQRLDLARANAARVHIDQRGHLTVVG